LDNSIKPALEHVKTPRFPADILLTAIGANAQWMVRMRAAAATARNGVTPRRIFHRRRPLVYLNAKFVRRYFATP
jgi:hypothetical protein